jgi:hypothetical protein
MIARSPSSVVQPSAVTVMRFAASNARRCTYALLQIPNRRRDDYGIATVVVPDSDCPVEVRADTRTEYVRAGVLG